MKQALQAHPVPQVTKIRTEKGKSLERNVTAAEMKEIAIVTVNAIEKESESAKENVREIGTAKIEKRAEAEVEAREKTIIREHAPPLLQATRNVIMAKEGIILKETILSFIKLTLLVNNGQKMPPKLKILIRMINQPL